MSELRQLDELVLPRLARGLTRITGGLRRWRVRPLPTVAVVLVAAVVVTIGWRLGEPDAVPGAGPHVRVGVTDGMSVAEYAAGAEIELNRLLVGPGAADPVYALVSLRSYLDAARVTSMVAAAGPQLVPVRAYARVPLPRRQTELVQLAAQRLPDDLLAAMATTAARKSADAQEYARRADAEQDAALRQILRSNAEVDAAEAAAYRNPGCVCIFALVVRGAPRVLQRLAEVEGVRVVDPAPEVTGLENTTFVGLLPEQVDRVAPVRDDGLDPPSAATPALSSGR